jgi:hypothetical protein
MIVESPTVEELKPAIIAASPKPAMFSLARQTMRRAQDMFAQRALKSDLSKLVSMAKDHEANGLAAGHEYYQLLYKLACEKAEGYARLRGIETQQLYAELASIEVLRKLANPGPRQARAGVLAVVLGVILIPIAIGIGSGMVSMGYRWALHIFGVH